MANVDARELASRFYVCEDAPRVLTGQAKIRARRHRCGVARGWWGGDRVHIFVRQSPVVTVGTW